jgi:succinate dehydrogenase/fumarate reductase cytochrome b subunit
MPASKYLTAASQLLHLLWIAIRIVLMLLYHVINTIWLLGTALLIGFGSSRNPWIAIPFALVLFAIGTLLRRIVVQRWSPVQRPNSST